MDLLVKRDFACTTVSLNWFWFLKLSPINWSLNNLVGVVWATTLLILDNTSLNVY